MFYYALIRKEAGTSYGVEFPDFPGLASGGETLDGALANAQEALALHIEGMQEDREDVPAPSALDVIVEGPDSKDAVAVLVPAPAPRSKVVRVNLTFDEQLLERIDLASATEGTSRSGWLANVARHSLGGVTIGSMAAFERIEPKAGVTYRATMGHARHPTKNAPRRSVARKP